MDVAVGQRIRDLRRARAMSLEAVAARTELSIGFLSQIERGLSSPSLRVLATLADVLGVGIAPALVSIRVSPESAFTLLGQTQQFNATGNYTNGSSQDLTGSVAWTVSAPSIATISTIPINCSFGSTQKYVP